MSNTVYRYTSTAVDPDAVTDSLPPGVALVSLVANPYLYADVTTDNPLADRADLDSVMSDQGWSFVEENPTSPPNVFNSWTVPAWFVDPVSGNDAADGTTSGTPVQHFAEIVKRWGTPTPLLRQDTTVTFLSDQPDFSDPVAISASVVGSTGTFTLRGGLTAQAGASGTFTTVTPRNRATATRWTITDSSKTGAFWTPFVGMLVHDTTADAWFCVTADLGGGSAEITEPMQSAVGNPTPAYAAIANGDAYQVFAPIKVNLVEFAVPTSSGNAPVVEHVWATGPSFGILNAGFSFFSECRVDTLLSPASSESFLNAANSYLFGVESDGCTVVGGAIVSELSVIWGAESVIDGDCVVLAPALAVEGTLVVGAGYFANALSVPNLGSLGGADGTLIVSGGAIYGTAAFWGPAALGAHVGGDVQYTGSAAAAFLNTGGMTLDGQTTAFSVDLTSGAWTPGVNVTPANLDTAAPAGFGGIAYGVRGTKIRQVA